MKRWHRAHPPASNPQEPADKAAAHAARLAAFEQAVARLDRDLADFDRRSAERRGLNVELARHAALWPEHLRLELTHTGLASTREELNREHAELMGNATVRRN